ncbi:MAG: hypothetical protein EPN82_02815 [Bacteroidetes bacterium]|nr:MAG: hypothetical protein EPN82_02815 [Bacteroidota bacterium]
MNFEVSDLIDYKQFEDLIADCFNAKERTNTYIIFGRSGQAQKGIDIYSSETKTAIQCKYISSDIVNQYKSCKNRLEKDIKNEATNASKSGLEIKHFILVSTFKHDLDIIKKAEKIKIENNLPFILSYIGWEEIIKIVKQNTPILDRYFPQVIDALDSREPPRKLIDAIGSYKKFPSDYWSLIPQIHGNTVSTELVPKRLDSHFKEPMIFNTLLKFDSENEQSFFLTQYNDFIKKGTPFQIEGKYIENLKIPEKLKPYFPEKINKLIFSPLTNIIPPLIVNFIYKDLDGVIYSLNKIPLSMVRRGTDEILLSYNDTNNPLKVNYLYNPILHKRKVDIKIDVKGHNIKAAYDTFKFLINLNKGGEFKIISDEIGFEIFKDNYKPKKVAKGKLWFLDFLKLLLFFQQTFIIQMKVPLEFNDYDFNYLKTIIHIVNNGYAEVFFSKLELNVTIAYAKYLVNNMKENQDCGFIHHEEGMIQLFNTKCNIGKIMIFFRPINIEKKSRNSIIKNKNTSNDNKIIKLKLEFLRKEPSYMFLEKFVPNGYSFDESSLKEYVHKLIQEKSENNNVC